MLPKSSLYFIILSLCFLISCTEKKKPISFSEKNITTATNTLVEINIPYADGDKEVAVQINKTLKQCVAEALQFNPDKKNTNTLEDNINNFNTEYNNFKSQFPESAQEWEAQIDGEVMFKSPEIISISLTTYSNTGGAHGTLVIQFLNFEAQTGKLLKTNELFINTQQFIDFAQPYFNTAIADKMEMNINSDPFVLPQNIGYSQDGLILLYNTYEIAPYTTGIIEFVIPFEEANSLLNFNGF